MQKVSTRPSWEWNRNAGDDSKLGRCETQYKVNYSSFSWGKHRGACFRRNFMSLLIKKTVRRQLESQRHML